MTETSRPLSDDAPGVVAMERAIAELRRGGLVAIRGSGMVGLTLVLAAELVNANSQARLVRFAASQAALAITGNRAAALKFEAAPSAVQSISLPLDMDADFVQQLADPTYDSADRLRARQLSIVQENPDGLAVRAIQLMKYARLLPAALFALVSRIDLDMAADWAQRNSVLMVNATDIDNYPELSAQRLSRAASARVPLADCEDTEIAAFRPLDGGTEHLAILIGSPDFDKPVLARLHSQCLTGDLLASLRCDCGDQLRGAIRVIAENAGGVLLYMAQEGRNIGLINKLRAYELQDQGTDTVAANEMLGFDADERFYQPAAEMLRQLGVTQVRLLTNNPRKIDGLVAQGIVVVERVPHIIPSNDHNAFYLSTKAERFGHLL